jgi:hypothetical protein
LLVQMSTPAAPAVAKKPTIAATINRMAFSPPDDDPGAAGGW